MSASPALVATVEDPDGRLLTLAHPHWSALHAHYSALFLECSPRTPPEVLSALQAAGAQVFQEREAPNDLAHLGQVRLRAMRRAVDAGHPWVHLCDWDRILHWLTVAPDELTYALAGIPAYDFLVFGRTQQAFESHPEAQRETERLANRAFAAAFGAPLDITAASRGVSARAIQALVDHSRVATLGVDAEWPLLLRRLGCSLGYFAAQGLSFETADRYQPEIEAAGSYTIWLDTQVNTLATWVSRLDIAHTIAAAAQDALLRPLPPSL